MTRLRSHLLAYPAIPAAHGVWNRKLQAMLTKAGVEV